MSLTLKKFLLVKDWSLSWIKWKDILYSPIINWHQFYFWRLVQIYFCSFHWCAIQQWEVYCSVWSLSALPVYTGKVSKKRAAKELVINFQNDLQNIRLVFSRNSTIINVCLSICLSVWNQNPSASQNQAYLPNLSLSQLISAIMPLPLSLSEWYLLAIFLSFIKTIMPIQPSNLYLSAFDLNLRLLSLSAYFLDISQYFEGQTKYVHKI